MLRCVLLLCLTVAVYGGGDAKAGNSGSGSGAKPMTLDAKPPVVARDNGTQEDCNAQFQTVADCLVDAFKQNEARVKAQFEKKKPDLEACFTNNKCKVPSAPKTDGADSQKMAQCKKAVMEKTKSSVEECVKQKFPNLKLPDIKFNDSDSHPPRFHPDQLCGILNESCPADANRSAIFACLHKAFANETKNIKKDFEQFCKDDMICVKQLSKSCQAQFFDVKEQAEKCMFDSFKNNITAGIPECSGISHEPPKDDQCGTGQHAMPAHPGHGIKGQAGPAGKGPAGPPKNKFNICGNFQDHQRANFGFTEKGGKSGSHGD